MIGQNDNEGLRQQLRRFEDVSHLERMQVDNMKLFEENKELREVIDKLEEKSLVLDQWVKSYEKKYRWERQAKWKLEEILQD